MHPDSDAPAAKRLEPAIRAFARGRGAFAAVLLLAPATAGRLWLGRRSLAVTALARLIGVRDVAIVAGLLSGRRRRTWLLAGVAADAADAVGSLAAGASMRRLRTLATAGVATGGVLAGLRLVAALPNTDD